MAVNKALSSTPFYIEVESVTDNTGAKIYKRKTFTGVNPTTTTQNVFDVAEAIKGV